MAKKTRAFGNDRFIIEDIGPKGDGIARGRNGVVFIDRALPEDEVEASLYKGDDGVTRGSIDRIVHASPFRDEPPCPYYERCGGCSLQHADDLFYRQFKQHIVQHPLSKVGIKPNFLPPVFCDPRTRRRATFATFMQNRQLIMGYYLRRSHIVSAIPDCLVCDPALIAWRDKIAPHLGFLIQDSRPVDVFLQMVDGACEIVITGPLGRQNTPDLRVRQAASELIHNTGAARLSWRLKPFDRPEVLIDAKPFMARFGSLSVRLPPAAFMQPTQEGQDALTNAVMNFLPANTKKAADLFCGCGTFTGPLLDRVAQVSAYDISGVDALAKAADRTRLTVQKRDLFKTPLRADELNAFDAVVFDPPRAGAADQVREIARSKVKCAIAVSCNPTTFAKDARILCDHGFRLDEVQIVDQFVWSHHVELVARFTR